MTVSCVSVQLPAISKGQGNSSLLYTVHGFSYLSVILPALG